MSQTDNYSSLYNSSKQPSESKKLTSFAAAFLFAFNLLFFGPVDIYLTNITDMTISSRYILIPALALGLLAVVIISVVLYQLKGKAHITALNIVTGLSLALYVQGNYLQMSSGVIDGSRFSINIGGCIIGFVVWAVCICIPFLVFKFLNDLYIKAVGFLTLMIFVMETAAMTATVYNIVSGDDTAILSDALMNNVSPYIHSQDSKYEFSSDHNLIVIITDEYDSFCFDSSLEEEPESAALLSDFTYYKNTIGMYSSSVPAINNIFSGKHLNDAEYPTDFFDSLKASDYLIDLYVTNNDVVPSSISSDYADNYRNIEITFRDIMQMNKCVYTLVGYKYSPEILKPLFHMTNAEVSEMLNANQSYYPDVLAFYNSIPDCGTLSGGNRFKLYYTYGLHDPRNITRDLKRVPDWTISAEEQAIAVNKVLSAYIDMLKKSGAYDNSDIIILADHGIKNHDTGKYPLLLIKRAGEKNSSMNISDIRVSYANIFPTLVYLAGGTPSGQTVFDLTSDDNQERYFATTDEYITGNIK